MFVAAHLKNSSHAGDLPCASQPASFAFKMPLPPLMTTFFALAKIKIHLAKKPYCPRKFVVCNGLAVAKIVA
jgi:hypothetical protein